MTQRQLLKGGRILTMDERLGELLRGDVLVEGDRIADIGVDLDVGDAEVVDATGMLVLPGLIDTHRHTWQTAMRGLGADFTGQDYRSCIKGRFAPAYRPEDVYISTLVGVLEALDGGITTILDWAHIMNSPEHADASIDALEESGSRAIFAHAPPNDKDSDRWWKNSDLPHPSDARRIRTQRLHSDDGLVTMALATRPPHLVTDEVMEHDWRLGRELGLRITTDGGLGGAIWGGVPWGPGGAQPIKRLADRGLLGPDTTYVHCNNLPQEELELIAESGGTVSISPDSEMQLGFNFPATGRVVAAGIRPAISTDLVMQVGGGMFAAMRAILNAERGLQGQAAYAESRGPSQWEITTQDVLSFATVEGARTTGLTHVGSLAPGKAADLILLDTRALNLQPMFNAVGLVVNQAHPGNVDSVMVNGRWVKRGGKLIHVDVDRYVDQLNAHAERLYDELDIPKHGSYRPEQHDPRWNW